MCGIIYGQMRTLLLVVRDDPKLLDDGGENSNLKKEVGGLIPNSEISSQLDRNLPCGQLPHVL